jgi:hypothetical protein
VGDPRGGSNPPFGTTLTVYGSSDLLRVRLEMSVLLLESPDFGWGFPFFGSEHLSLTVLCLEMKLKNQTSYLFTPLEIMMDS